MPIEAVKIPQNVYVEDRIIGPVTLKQLIITGIGAGIGYMGFAIATKAGAGLPFQIMAWVPTVFALAFAFLTINDLSLFNIILLFIEGMNKPSERFWSPHQGISINLITRQISKEAFDANTKIADNASKLADITRQLEKRQHAMDQLAAHQMPEPDALEPVKSKFDAVLAPTTDTVTGPAVVAEEIPLTLPVNPSRVQSDGGLVPEKSIDGIAAKTAFAQFIPTVSA